MWPARWRPRWPLAALGPIRWLLSDQDEGVAAIFGSLLPNEVSRRRTRRASYDRRRPEAGPAPPHTAPSTRHTRDGENAVPSETLRDAIWGKPLRFLCVFWAAVLVRCAIRMETGMSYEGCRATESCLYSRNSFEDYQYSPKRTVIIGRWNRLTCISHFRETRAQ